MFDVLYINIFSSTEDGIAGKFELFKVNLLLFIAY